MWIGNGPDEKPLRVAVEYKTLSEILDHVAGESGRFVGHQVEGLIKHYDRRYLLIEGRMRADRNSGVLQRPIWNRVTKKYGNWEDIVKGGRRFMFRDLEHWLTSVEEMAGFRIVKSQDEFESARWVIAKHSWYVHKGWDEHKTMHKFHVALPPTAQFTKPSLVRRVAKELSGVGWGKSIDVAARFPSVLDLALGNEEAWQQVDGIGKLMAGRIVKEIRDKGGR